MRRPRMASVALATVTSLAIALPANAVLAGPPHLLFASASPGVIQTPTVPQSQGSFFRSNADLEEILDDIVSVRGVKGVAIGLLEPNGRRRILSAGTGGPGSLPLGADTVFEIGSITKTFAGVLLAEAVARGEVKIDDPVANHLPAGVKVPSRGNRQITLLDLATHRSGLPRLPTGYTAPDISNPYAAIDDARLYAWLSAYQLERAPGDGAEYSNVGYALLGHALARAAGSKDFPQLVHERVLRPLGMRRTSFERSAELDAWRATGHDKAGTVVPYWDVGSLTGAGGLNSSMSDMLTYLEANVGAPRTSIERSMRHSHQSRSDFAKDRKIGLGWQLASQEGQMIVIHNGGSGGFSTVMAFNPENGAGVVILANSATFDGRDAIAMQLLKGPGLNLAPSELTDYSGVYPLGNERAITIREKNGKLYGNVTGQPPLRLFPSGKDRFSLIAAGADIAFSRDGSGRVQALTLYQDGQVRSVPRSTI